MTAELLFITRDQCGLCDEALARLRPLAKVARVAVVLRDVTEMPDASMAERVPVLVVGQTERHAGPLTWPDALRVVLMARFTRG